MNTIALNIYNRTRHSSIVDFNYLWTEPQTPTRLKWTTYQACLGLFYSWSFLATIFIFIFVIEHPHKVLNLLGSFQHSAVVFIDYRIKNNISWLIYSWSFSCYQTILLVRKNWLTWLDFLSSCQEWLADMSPCQERLAKMSCFMNRLDQISF